MLQDCSMNLAIRITYKFKYHKHAHAHVCVCVKYVFWLTVISMSVMYERKPSQWLSGGDQLIHTSMHAHARTLTHNQYYIPKPQSYLLSHLSSVLSSFFISPLLVFLSLLMSFYLFFVLVSSRPVFLSILLYLACVLT